MENALRARWRRAGAVLRRFWCALSWGDRALLAGVLVASAGFVPWLQSGLPGAAAVVRLNNEVVVTLPLKAALKYSVWGPLGETVLQVEPGRVRVLQDPGPQQLCVRQGWISRAGEALICLPNRIVVEIPGPPDYDSVVK